MGTAEVVARLGVSRMTIIRMIDEGVLTPIPKNPLLKRPQKLLFRREEVEALANRK